MKKFVLALLASGFCVPVSASDGRGQTVVVIDTGFDKNHILSYARKSACFSENEFSTGQPSSKRTFPTSIIRRDIATTDFIYTHNIMSKCPNRMATQRGSRSDYAVNMPLRKKYRDVVTRDYRLVNSNASLISSSFDSFYSDVTVRHGTNVASQVSLFAPSVQIFPIVVGSVNRQTNCGVNGKTSEEYNQNLSDRYFNHFDKLNHSTGCGRTTSRQIRNALDHVLSNPSGVIAVNVSLGVPSKSMRSMQEARSTITRLNNRGIAVIAAVGNTNGRNVEWPACLDNVIGVAQSNGAGAAVGNSIRDNKQDFFLSGGILDYDTLRSTDGTSFASPKLTGIYASLKSINPRASITDITNVLRNTGSDVNGFAGKRVNYEKAVAGIRKVTGSPPTTTPQPPTTSPTPPTTGGGGSSGSGATPRPPTPVGQTAVLGFVDDALQTGAAVYNVFLNGSASLSVNQRSLNPLNANINISDVRDIRLDFEGKYTTRANPRDVRGMEIVINDVSRIVFNTVQPYGDGNSAIYRPHSFILNRNWFQSGNNKIVIREKAARRDAPIWSERTRKVRMEYNSPLNMRLGQTVNKLHGHSFGTKIHQTGLRVTFSGSTSDVNFSATGFDIDTDTEVAVFLNHRRVGFLNRGSNARNSSANKFKFRKADLVSSGVNTIEFVNTSTSDREVWGVTNLKLDGAPPDISGIIMMLLSDD